MISFRDFEERDVDFIYQLKNNKELNKRIVAQWKPYTYEEARKWVNGCIGNHDTYKFWVICTNDSEKKAIGYASISEIDHKNKSVCFHGIVISDPDYNDGFAWIETYLFIYNYIFEVLKFNRVYAKCRVDHKMTMMMRKLMFAQQEGIYRQALYADGEYHDLSFGALLSHEYFTHKENGDYELKAIIKRLRKIKKEDAQKISND